MGRTKQRGWETRLFANDKFPESCQEGPGSPIVCAASSPSLLGRTVFELMRLPGFDAELLKFRALCRLEHRKETANQTSRERLFLCLWRDSASAAARTLVSPPALLWLAREQWVPADPELKGRGRHDRAL